MSKQENTLPSTSCYLHTGEKTNKQTSCTAAAFNGLLNILEKYFSEKQLWQKGIVKNKESLNLKNEDIMWH